MTRVQFVVAGASAPALATYPMQLVVCTLAGLAGALMWQLVQGEPLFRGAKAGRTRGLVLAGAMFSGVFSPLVASRVGLHNELAALVFLAGALGLGAHALIPIVPTVLAQIMLTAARMKGPTPPIVIPQEPPRDD